MKKKFSTREIVLLGLLAIILIFYFVNKGPIQRITENLESQKMELEGEIALIEPYTNQMALWQKELDAIFEEYGEDAKSIPDYNNINNVIREMSTLFDGDKTYSISFADPTLEDHIVQRELRISFSAGSYSGVMKKLKKIADSENRYRITNVSISGEGDDGYAVSVNLTAYEYTEKEEL